MLSFLWINLNPFQPNMLCNMFGWDCQIGSGEEGENLKRVSDSHTPLCGACESETLDSGRWAIGHPSDLGGLKYNM